MHLFSLHVQPHYCYKRPFPSTTSVLFPGRGLVPKCVRDCSKGLTWPCGNNEGTLIVKRKNLGVSYGFNNSKRGVWCWQWNENNTVNWFGFCPFSDVTFPCRTTFMYLCFKYVFKHSNNMKVAHTHIHAYTRLFNACKKDIPPVHTSTKPEGKCLVSFPASGLLSSGELQALVSGKEAVNWLGDKFT